MPAELEELAAHWRTWIGRTDESTDTVRPELATELMNALGVPWFTPGSGLPPGAHWLLSTSFPPGNDLGLDGHLARGGFLPPIALPRRMWAGGRIHYDAPLEVGMAVTRSSEITDVQVKTGRHGPLVFVTLAHRVSAGGEVLVREEQDLAYMNIPAAAEPVAELPPEQPTPFFKQTIVPDEVMLFRYSALTRNSHRIHYDHDYARSVENYPTVVVHGPLTATLLQWFALSCFGRQRLKSFSFRARSPLFVAAPLELSASAGQDQSLDLVARMRGHAASMTAQAAC